MWQLLWKEAGNGASHVIKTNRNPISNSIHSSLFGVFATSQVPAGADTIPPASLFLHVEPSQSEHRRSPGEAMSPLCGKASHRIASASHRIAFAGVEMSMVRYGMCLARSDQLTLHVIAAILSGCSGQAGKMVYSWRWTWNAHL